jgi:hypothetical protein
MDPIRTLAASWNTFAYDCFRFFKPCQGKPDYSSWNCCEKHQRLEKRRKDLLFRAKSVLLVQEDEDYFSSYWWNKLGYVLSQGDETKPSRVDRKV